MSQFVLPVLQGVDFMAEAKEVIGLATLLSACDNIGDDDALRLEALRLIDKELNIVYMHFQDLPVDCIISSALRTRLEYVVRMVHLFLKKSDYVQAQNLSSMNIHLLFELLKILEQRVDSEAGDGTPDESFTTDATTPFVESELRKQHAEKNMGVGRTQWLEMSFTAVALALVTMLRKVPAAYTLLDLNLADSIALTLSSHWPMQCLGLCSVCCMLQYEKMCDAEALIGNSSNDNNSMKGSGIAAMQRKIDSFNNHHTVHADDPVIPTNIVNMLSKGKSSKVIAGNDAIRRGSKSVVERRTSNNNMNTSSSGSKLTRVSTSAGSGNSVTTDGSLATTNMDNRNNNSNNNMASSKVNRSNSMALRKSASTIQQGSFRALVQTNRAARCVDDICKSGYLRTIVALLLHNKEIIRKLAAEVLQLILDISTPSNSNNNSDSNVTTFVTDICACCVEQGLVAQLEYICQGIFIQHNPAMNTTAIDAATDRPSELNADTVVCFPERSIRTLCTTLLHHLVREVDTHATLLTRLTSAMLHSGNTKLKVNIFSGLMYLAGRCPAIGRKLCVPVADLSTAPNNSILSQSSNVNTSIGSAPNTKSIKGSLTSAKTATINSTTSSKANATNNPITTATAANPTAIPATLTDITNTDSTLTTTTPRRTLFYDMLTTLARDATDFRSLLRVMIHFMEHTLTLQQEIQARSEGTNMNVTEASVRYKNALVYKIEPMVLISDQTRTTRMICPPLSIIEQHSVQLAALVKNAMERQVGVAMESLQNRNSTTSTNDNNNNIAMDKEKHLMQALKGMDDSYLVTLQGSYNMWQEIFSHMSDSYLLQTSVPKISTIGLLECFYITTQFGMKTLGGKYSEALVQRLDNNNFIQIFRASVGLYFPPKVIVPSISSKNTSSTDGSTDIDATPLALHLYQAVHCMKYLDMNMERVVTIWKPKDTTLIVDCVHRLVLCLFLSDD